MDALMRRKQRNGTMTPDDWKRWRVAKGLPETSEWLGDNRINIDGDLYTWNGNLSTYGQGKDYANVGMDDGTEWTLCLDEEVAQRITTQYYLDMAEHNPEEIKCFVGTEALVAWGLGQWHHEVKSLKEWCENNEPVYHLAGVDHTERTVNRIGRLVDELGFTPTVAYQCN